MSKHNAESEMARIDKKSTGGHLGGTHYGQAPGDAPQQGQKPNQPKPDAEKRGRQH